MSEEKQPVQPLPFPLDVTDPRPSQQPGEGGQLGSSDDQHMNGVCCQ